jgi:hypothetical protein
MLALSEGSRILMSLNAHRWVVLRLFVLVYVGVAGLGSGATA